jgi:flagellar motor protein MotB
VPLRFHGHGNRSHSRIVEATNDSGFGEWWAAIAVLALAAVGIVSLSGSAGPTTAAVPKDPSGEILAAISPAERTLAAVSESFAELCKEPVLLAVELEPNCETGVITLSDDLFDGFGGATLLPEAQQDLLAAMQIYLSRIRRMPAIWNVLEAIEIRGHADPRAVRDPYTTNLVGSQQRPVGVLMFLVGSDGLAVVERIELEELAVVSGASYSRPPESCPTRTRECYEQWRRVEIRPVLSESLRRQDWSRTLDSVRVATEGGE